MDSIFTEYELQKIEEAKKIYSEYIPEKTSHNFINLVGKRYGYLIVLYRTLRDGCKAIYYVCLCDCGNICVVRSNHLTQGDVKSCGCYQKQCMSQRTKQYNRYDLSQEYGIGYTNKGEKFYFDLKDYDLIKDYCWRFNSKGYVVARYDEHHDILIHRLILNVSDGQFVDHIDGRPQNNQKENLRIVSIQQNNLNHKIYKNNTSGHTGVQYITDSKKWRADINYQKKYIYLGTFNTKEEAVFYREKAEQELFGKYNRTKDLL